MIKTILIYVILVVLTSAILLISLVLGWSDAEAARHALVIALAVIGVCALTTLAIQLLADFSDKK